MPVERVFEVFSCELVKSCVEAIAKLAMWMGSLSCGVSSNALRETEFFTLNWLWVSSRVKNGHQKFCNVEWMHEC